MLIAVRTHGDDTETRLCYTGDELSSFFFSPVYDDKYVIPLTVSGRTYQERKNDLESKAIEYSNIMGTLVNISWSEYADITDFFERNGRRYGLLTDFRENCIC